MNSSKTDSTAPDSDARTVDRRTFVGGATAAMAVGALLSKAAIPAAVAEETGYESNGPVIETTAGRVRGGRQGPVSFFKGVHYGASTSGSRRFLPPVKPAPWSGVRPALKLGLRSPQEPEHLIPEVLAVADTGPMGEDCLVLNVWTPEASPARKRPVMVWLHGGGYAGGSGGFAIYDGTNLAAKHDVVVVTLNHRLNAFGYLFLADVGGPKYSQASNVGMLDIVLALEWVRDNIAAFGGDPANVTIFGQSGGGGKVSTLQGMTPAKGLFHRAIVMSGSAIDGVSRDAATQSTAAFMANLGLSPTPRDVDRMQAMSVQQLLAATTPQHGNFATRLAPVVDGFTLPADPFDPFAPSVSADVPLLIGTMQDEVGFFPGFPVDPIPESALLERIKQTLHATDAQAAKVIAAYRKDQPGLTPIDVAMEVASDMFTWRNGVTQAERKAALGAAPVYMYYFQWESPVDDGKLKAFHTLDIPFAFDNVDIGKSMTGTGQDRYALQDKMSSAFVAFARTGNPNTHSIPHWPAYDMTRRATMFVNNQWRVVDDPRRDDRLVLAAFRGRF